MAYETAEQFSLKMNVKRIAEEQIRLFTGTFRGRHDVVPRHWRSKRGHSGFSPLCKNEWKMDICKKPCRQCPNAEYISLSNSLLIAHFQGEHILGVYPLFNDDTCYFIAADFDDHCGDRDPLEDVKNFHEVCEVQDIPVYILRSKSGTGYHAYIFFNSPIPARKARIAVFALLQVANVVGDNIEVTSFDRLFPSQDRLSGKGFGNLIALPFQGNAAKKGHTLFLDPDSGFIKPFKNQWTTLSKVLKTTEPVLDELVSMLALNTDTVNSSVSKSWTSNKSIKEITKCRFMKWCLLNPERVNEPLWYAMISNLASVRPGGYSLCHEFSKGHRAYTKMETDEKIHQALDSSRPHTCKYIQNNGFKCNKTCNVRSPVALLFNHLNNRNGDPNNVEKKRIKISIGGS